MYKKNTIIIVIGGLVVMGLVFYAGMKLGSKDQSDSNYKMFSGQFDPQASGMQKFGGQNGLALNRTGGMNGGASGEVIAKDDKSITVKLKDGGSKIVFYSEKTSVLKTATTSLNDVLIGEQVAVIGSSNQDGSVNADSIQLRNSK
jgi:hypothetical protein